MILVSRGAKVEARVGSAIEMAKQAAASASKFGLHVVFLDPYNAAALPFEVPEQFFHLKHVDFIVHYSENDIQRNLEQAITDETSHLDLFAPGWRDAVDVSAKATMRVHFMNHWLSLFAKHGFKHAESMPLIVNSKDAPLYKLVLISRADLALKLWNAVTNKAKQKKLF